MHPITACMQNPVKVAVGVILVALFGVLAIFNMPVQLSPDVDLPRITVNTVWPGASPHEVEKEIVRKQEEVLKAVEGVTKMSSTCGDSNGSVTLEFRTGTDIQEALIKVNSQLQQVADYPIDADKPVIQTSDPSENAMAWFLLTPRPVDDEQIRAFGRQHPQWQADIDRILRAHSEGLKVHRLKKLAAREPSADSLLPDKIDITKFRRFAQENIEAQLERVAGVSNAEVFGGQEEELQVVVEPKKLAARGLTVADVRRALTEDNKDTSAGDFDEGKRRVVVRTLGEYRSLDQVKQQIVANPNGQPIYVSDVADVRLDYKKPSGFVRRLGIESIALNCQREHGANVIQVMESLREKVRELNAGLLKREGLYLEQVYDETEYIHSAIGLVQSNIMLGSALTIIVLLVFLHLNFRVLVFIPLLAFSSLAALLISPWFFAVTLALILISGLWFARGALVVSLAIPTSIVGTFLILNMLGRSLNVISLAGLSFAVGMLVDNSIVVLENTFTYAAKGHRPFEAARLAAIEVWGAVLASTMTTLAVFIPVVFLEGEVGQLFLDIALAISAAVGLSLIVSVILIPTASARLLNEHEQASHGAIQRGIREFGTAFADFFVGVNQWLRRTLVRQVALVVGTVCGSLAIAYAFWPSLEYLPTGNRNLIISLVLPPPGYNVNELSEIGEVIEKELEPYWDYDLAIDTEPLDYPAIGDLFCVAFGRTVFFGLESQDPLECRKLINLIFQRFGGRFPGSFVVAFQTSLFSGDLGAGRSIDVEITGPEIEKLVQIGGRIMGQTMQFLPPDTQARPVPGLDLSSPELHVTKKSRQSSDLGINTVELGYAVNTLIDGAFVTDYFLGGERIDMVLVTASANEANSQDLQSQYLATRNMAEPVRLDALADVKLGSGPESINRRERQRTITIQITPSEAMSTEETINILKANIIEPLEQSGELGTDYRLNLSGTADKLAQAWIALRGNVLLAVLITYLLLAALFESWTYPLVIILSVPLGAVGGVVGLTLLNIYLRLGGGHPQALDVITMLGFVILIGTVVNNPILIVHHSLNLIRSEGYGLAAAIEDSVRTRTRPIFMTTLTTVFGLLPLVLFPGAGSELYRGLGAVVLGGLVVSAAFTLILVPTVFAIAFRTIEGIKRGFRNQPPRGEEPSRRPQERHDLGNELPIPATTVAQSAPS
jgi:HAE1 family hydrophobic/amphiphilic exporter-1